MCITHIYIYIYIYTHYITHFAVCQIRMGHMIVRKLRSSESESPGESPVGLGLSLP